MARRLPMLHAHRSALLLLLLLSGARFAQGANGSHGDEQVIEDILYEGKENSQVWQTLNHLSDDIGARLTGSTRCLQANEWARDEFERMGLSNSHLQQWGTIPVGFDRGPSRARMVEPIEREFEFTTLSWGPGTDGPVRAEVRRLPTTMAELEEVGFDYAGCWILCPPRERSRGRGTGSEDRTAREERQAIDAALEEIGSAGRLVSSSNELVLTSSIRDWSRIDLNSLPDKVEVQIRKSDFEAVAEALDAGEPVIVEIDLAHHFVPGPVPVYNTIAEIPGSARPEEVVIISGHLDSWDGPGSKGSQDNGTGSAVVLETARILMAAKARPLRTIRFALWTGEEQGLLGSGGYVASLSEEERARVSACFVDDGGTNYQGGLVCLDSQAELFEAAIAPVAAAFPELPVTITGRATVSGGMGSDHASFNAVGIPGFFWMESGSGGREGKNYEFVHHTQHDTQRYAVEEYLVQSATCSAVVAYQIAMLPELLPRDNPNAKKPATAADPSFVVVAGPFTGEWELSVLDEDAPDIRLLLSLEMARDGRLRGMSTAMGISDVLEGKWDASAGSASLGGATEFGPVKYTLGAKDGTLVGTLAVMGRDFDIRGEPKLVSGTPISGLWRGQIPAMDASISLFFQVRQSGELVGRFQSSQSDSPLFDGKWDAGSKSLSFEYDYPHGGRLPVEAHLEGEKLVGRIGENAEFEALRNTDG